tara:strand:- start:212 stop:340 length:129 start_codon:yes stop_codon:yes gene_type:complete
VTVRSPGGAVYRPLNDNIERAVLDDGEAGGKGQEGAVVAVFQ